MLTRIGRVFDTVKSNGYKNVGASEFLKIATKNRDLIDSVTFIPPVIGSNNFGRFRVKLKGLKQCYEVEAD